MATWIFDERPKSGDFTANPDTYTLKYVAGPHGDEGYVKAYALTATPMIFKGLWRQSIQAKHIGGGLFHIDVPYNTTTPPDPAVYSIRYDTTGGTAHVTQAKEHLEDFGIPGEDPPDHKGAIGVQSDGRAEGTDIVVSAFKWSETWTLPISFAGWPYSQVLKAITGKTNGALFRAFPIGHVLFKGATANHTSGAPGTQTMQITYQFEQQDSVTNLTFDEVTLVTKVGWEQLWFEHEITEDDVASRQISKLVAVHRERHYDVADFNLIGIGS